MRNDYLSLCCIVRDENSYLPEWIRYHLNVGVQYLYIYDNGSQVPVSTTLRPWIDAGQVQVLDFPGQKMQFRAYDHCLQTFGHNSRWIGFIDTDEFVVPKSTETVSEFLTGYEKFGGVGINWLVFGSSGHKTRPDGLQIENFLTRAHENQYINQHIKSFVQPSKTLRVGADPHHFIYKPGHTCVDPNRVAFSGAIHRNCTDTIQLNHYFLRSEDEFRQKTIRGRSDTGVGRTMQEFYDTDRYSNVVRDESILRFISLTDKTGL